MSIQVGGRHSGPGLRIGPIRVAGQTAAELACHKRVGIAIAITKAGVQLRYLPSYGPNRTPIEKAFSKLKTRLRAAKRALEVEDFLDASSGTFREPECRN